MMKKNYVMVDYESVQPKSLELLKPEHFSIRIFLGPTNTKLARGLVTAMQAMGTRAEYVELDVSAKNALDFHIAYYLGRIAAVEPEAYFQKLKVPEIKGSRLEFVWPANVVHSRSLIAKSAYHAG
jgi:hypothetical protein